MFGVDVPDLGSTRVSLSQNQTLNGNYHFTTLNVPSIGGFSGKIKYKYEGRDQSLYGMCGKLLRSSITDTQTFTKARSFKHLDATTGVTTGTGTTDTKSVSVGSDNFNIKNLYTSSYKLDQDNTITSTDFTIQDELTVSKDVNVGGTAENVDVLALASDVVIDASEDLTITAPSGNIVIDGEITIKEDQLLTTIPEWGENFTISFQLWIESKPAPNPPHNKDGWAELLRFEAENQLPIEGCPGCDPTNDRIPGILLNKAPGIGIGMDMPAENTWRSFGDGIKIKSWINVTLTRYVEGQEDIFVKKVDGQYTEVHKFKKFTWHGKLNPRQFKNVKVYAAKKAKDYYLIADAKIKNLVITAGAAADTTVTVSSNSHSISVPGKKTFTQPLTVTNDITTSGHLVVSDGSSDRTFTSGDLSAGIYNRILRKTGAAQTVSTNIVLDGNLKIDKDLQADSIDDVAFSAISAKYEYSSTDDCPTGWSYFDKTRKCYKHDTTKRTWNDSLTFCQNSASNRSSTLASVHDLETNLFIKQISNVDENDAWLGGSQDDLEKWSWADGSSLGYTNWVLGEPNDHGGNEDHMAIKFKNGNGVWNDDNGLTKQTGAICQCNSHGTHEVKNAFNFSGSAITVNDLVTSSVRGRDWSGFVQDILSKNCTDVKIVMGGDTSTFKFTGQYTNQKPVYESTFGKKQLSYASDRWQLKSLDDGSVLGSAKSESSCPEVSGWTWTDGSTTNAVSQGI